MSDSTRPGLGLPPPDELPAAAGSAPPPVPPVAGFQVGDRVVLEAALTYLKTADPMPMLRPPDLVDAGEQGQVVEIRALGQLAVRFRRGTFLLAIRDLRAVSAEP